MTGRNSAGGNSPVSIPRAHYQCGRILRPLSYASQSGGLALGSKLFHSRRVKREGRAPPARWPFRALSSRLRSRFALAASRCLCCWSERWLMNGDDGRRSLSAKMCQILGVGGWHGDFGRPSHQRRPTTRCTAKKILLHISNNHI